MVEEKSGQLEALDAAKQKLEAIEEFHDQLGGKARDRWPPLAFPSLYWGPQDIFRIWALE